MKWVASINEDGEVTYTQFTRMGHATKAAACEYLLEVLQRHAGIAAQEVSEAEEILDAQLLRCKVAYAALCAARNEQDDQ